ncbi:MOSC domain-containing protein [Pseudonocardia acidicola]|uniref:MOSC domain-containing protein n=1 Tax=Pseudonocardia acidicola TaxID=2724939 RepID=A0ABX1SN67_9PSEU|nr:MOSC N-terminal beta barrel domain-containing protein [Pseudonocardia acidicola]NMI02028.1 MOSC domain-containing protein [Pseudonocardia acidicola]
MTDGVVVSLWRYPVKSMMGEELNASHITDRGLLGDRALALVDAETGNVVSAKNPRRWPAMFDFRAAFSAPPDPGDALPSVRVTLPDGSMIDSDDRGFADVVSAALGRPVSLLAAAPSQPVLEEYWPDMAELAQQEVVTEEAMPAGTFFDLATVHVLTTATIDRLRELYPRGRFEPRRFRPNIIVRPTEGGAEFVESKWVGRRLRIGDDVVLETTDHCPRCVMTTLPQGDLPKDSDILRTAARHNDVHVGVYAEVREPGVFRRGDPVCLD